MKTEQIAVRLSAELVHDLDELVTQGVFDSRAAVVRAGITSVADQHRRRATDQAIIDGYLRIPPSPDDDSVALASLRESIAEEPW